MVVQFAAALAFSVWVGGFTFYSAAVIHVLHDELDSLQAGSITQQVTDRLNAVGVAALVLCGIGLRLDRAWDDSRTRRILTVLLATSALLLVFLFVMHEVMDRRLAASGLRGFYALHRVYLHASTAQWVVNLALMAGFLVARDRR